MTLSVLSSALASSASAAPAPGFSYPFVFGPFPKILSSNPAETLAQSRQNLEADPEIHAFLQDVRHQLSPTQSQDGSGVRTVKYQDTYHGLEVLGSMALHHEGPEGVQITDALSRFDLDVTPRLDPSEALSLVRARIGDRELQSVPELKILPRHDGSAELIYQISLKSTATAPGADLLVAANTGETIAELSHHWEIEPEMDPTPPTGRAKRKPVSPKLAVPLIDVYGANAKCQSLDEEGFPSSIQPSLCTAMAKSSQLKAAADEAGTQAFKNAQSVATYYAQIHGRNSFDNKGTRLVNVVHVGKEFANAFWDTEDQIMGYGDGDGVHFASFTRAADVAGHEMTHGVTSVTAKLMMMGESGALNEAYSDFFGKMISNDGDWVMGKKIFKDPNAQGIRNLKDPGSILARVSGGKDKVTKKPYPSKMSEEFPIQEPCDSSNDRCWVHLNSTIPSHASYLTAVAIGAENSEKLTYLTLTQYLTPAANFKDARDATLKACAQLFAAATCKKVEGAWSAVGL